MNIESQVDFLSNKLAEALAVVIDVSIERINIDTPLSKLSLDSMALSHFRNWILRNLDINYPIMKLIKGPSIKQVSEELVTQVNPVEIKSTTTPELATEEVD